MTHAEAAERDAEQEGHRGAAADDAVRDNEEREEAAAVDSYYSAAEAAVPYEADARAVAVAALREARRDPRETERNEDDAVFGAEEAAAMVDAIGVPIFAPARCAAPQRSMPCGARPLRLLARR